MSRVAAGKAVASSIDEDLAGNGLVRYRLAPPSWQAPWLLSRTAQESGYPQFFPTAIGQEEDQLTESAIKSGFIGKAVVQTETFSAHQLIYEKLKGETILPALAALAASVAERAKSHTPVIAPAAFRLPSRVTATEAKKNAWTADLANPAVALSKISRNIPHGYRGEKLLEMVYTLRVPLDRAVWCIRAIGGTEVQPQKARPGFSIAQYTYEWTAVVLDFFGKQLGELATSTGPTLENLAFRTAWTTRFTYFRQLVAALYEEHLLDRQAVLNFLIQQIDSSNSSQLPFVVPLLQEYMDEFLASELLAARMAASGFQKLLQIESSDPVDVLAGTAIQLVTILRSTFVSLPDAFIVNPLWALHSDKLDAILLRSSPHPNPIVTRTILADLADLKSRRHISSQSSSHDDSSVESRNFETIRLLDEIAFPSSIATTHRKLFHNRGRKRTVAQELPTLFAWAISPDRYGSYRSYAVGKLIALELATPSGSDKVIDVEGGFISWIDTVRPEEWDKVRLLLAELIRARVVSYSSYLHRMIARGETEAKADSTPSLHLSLLRTVALFDEPGLPISKRRSALRASPNEARNLIELVAIVEAELESLIPGLTETRSESTSEKDDCSRLFEVMQQVSEIGGHLAITRETIPVGVARLLRNSTFTILHHSILAEVFLTVSDHYGLFSYLLVVLQSSPARPLLLAVLNTIESCLDIWTATGSLPTLGSALYGAHESLRSNGINDRRIVALLRQLGSNGHLTPAIATSLEESYSAFILSLSSGVPQAQRLVSNLPELQGLLVDHSPASIAQVATTLWYRYHSYENWGIVIFEASIQLLVIIPVPVIANLLRELHERLPAGLDGMLEKWMGSVSESNLVDLAGGGLSGLLVELKSTLASEGHITGSILLGSFVVPAITAILNSSSDRTTALRSTLDLVAALLGSTGTEGATSTTLFAKHRSSSRRATLFTLPNLPIVGQLIALLHVTQSLTPSLPPDSLEVITKFFKSICGSSAFRGIVAKEPERLASSMLESRFAKGVVEKSTYRSQILVGLLSCLKNGKTDAPANLVSREDWDVFLSSLTIWRLAISKVEVQACLQGLDLDQSLSESKKQEALHNLARHFLDRVCLSGGETYLGEQVVRCYHGKASDELVSVAFARLVEAIDGISPTSSSELFASSLVTLQSTGRLLNTLLESGSATSRAEPLALLVTAIRDWFARALDEDDPARTAENGKALLQVANVVDVALRCTGSGMAEVLALCRDCVSPAAGLALKYATASPPNLVLATVLLDTVSRLLLTLSTLAPTLRHPSLQSILLSTAQHSIPDAILSRLIRLLSPLSDTTPGTTTPSSWEMVDHADPAAIVGFSVGGQKSALAITNGPMRLHNIAPLDLAAFSARVVEIIPSVTAMNAPSPSSVRSATPTSTPVGSTTTNPTNSNERGLQTNFDSEVSCVGISMLARDYRRSLVSETIAGSGPTTTDRTTKSTPTSGKKRARPDLTIDDSPPVSTSRSAGSTTGAAIGRGAKRKDPPEVVIIDSDEEEKVEAPPVRAPPAKRGRTASKTTASKTTASKTTARGGKGKKRGG